MIYYCRWHVVFFLFLLSVNLFSFDCFFSNSDDSFSLFRFGIFFLTRMTYFRCAIWIWFRSKAKITRKEQTKPTYCVQICKYKRNHPNYDGLLRWFGYICFTIGRLFINLKWETKKKNSISSVCWISTKAHNRFITYALFVLSSCCFTRQKSLLTKFKWFFCVCVCFFRRFIHFRYVFKGDILYLVHLLNSNEMSGSTGFKFNGQTICCALFA